MGARSPTSVGDFVAQLKLNLNGRSLAHQRWRLRRAIKIEFK